MAEILKVSAIGPFGINCKGTWYKLGKGITSAQFEKGKAYSVEVSTGTKGSKFINAVLSQVEVPAQPLLNPNLNASSVIETDTPKKVMGQPQVLNEYGKLMSDYALAKDKRISRSGVIQAAVQAMTNHVSDREQLEKESILLAEAMLKWVNEK